MYSALFLSAMMPALMVPPLSMTVPSLISQDT